MKKSLVIRLVILFMAASMLSGCFWQVEDDGYGRGGYSHERDRGEHRGDRHDGPGDPRRG